MSWLRHCYLLSFNVTKENFCLRYAEISLKNLHFLQMLWTRVYDKRFKINWNCLKKKMENSISYVHYLMKIDRYYEQEVGNNAEKKIVLTTEISITTTVFPIYLSIK